MTAVGSGLRGSVITLCTPGGRFIVDTGTDCRVRGLLTCSVLLEDEFSRRGEDSVDFGDVEEALSLFRCDLPKVILNLFCPWCISTRLSRKSQQTLYTKKPGTTRIWEMADQLSPSAEITEEKQERKKGSVET